MSCHVCWRLVLQLKLDGLAARENSVPQSSAGAQEGSSPTPASPHKLIQQLQRWPWQAVQADGGTAGLVTHSVIFFDELIDLRSFCIL
jgi:hypothetical protein